MEGMTKVLWAVGSKGGLGLCVCVCVGGLNLHVKGPEGVSELTCWGW